MSLTIQQLKAMSFGYLTGSDLLQWCAGQLLIKQYEVDPTSLQNGCNFAYSEVIGQLSTRYKIAAELSKVGTILAAGEAILTAGVVTSIRVVTPGVGYTGAPTVAIQGGGGAGATAIAVLLGASVTSFTVSAGGTGYTSTPTVALTGGITMVSRPDLLVEITAKRAVKNILANLQNVSQEMKDDFKEAKQNLLDIRNGQLNLPLEASTIAAVSDAFLVPSSFSTIG